MQIAPLPVQLLLPRATLVNQVIVAAVADANRIVQAKPIAVVRIVVVVKAIHEESQPQLAVVHLLPLHVVALPAANVHLQPATMVQLLPNAKVVQEDKHLII